jgi:predicted RNA binding protein YcfA (HicA-like mRNA interferase family)
VSPPGQARAAGREQRDAAVEGAGMAKIKKLLKALESAGWQPSEERDTMIQFVHPKRAGRLTLPSGKCVLPDDVAAQVLAAAGIKTKGA